MDSQSATRAPGEARGWRFGLSCLSLASVIAGMFAGIYLLGTVLTGTKTIGPALVVPIALTLFPVISLGLGLWTWKANRVWRLASVMAMLAGGVGLTFVVVPAVIALISTMR